MKHFFLQAVFVLFITNLCYSQTRPDQSSALYAIAELPTPVLNTPDFSFVFGSSDGNNPHLDESGLIREVEFVALPTTVFKVEQVLPKKGATIYRVTTVDYPYHSKKGFFIDSRFASTVNYKPSNRLRELPPKKAIIHSLISAESCRYVWGGNYRAGIPQMLMFYPPPIPLTQEVKDQWTLRGLDCSGLLYEATNGCTPRNTGSLITVGEAVPIANLNADQIIQALEPLDILVWKGHVIIVLDKDRAIESRLDYDTQRAGNQGGVKIRKLKDVLDETLQERIPVNNYADDLEGGDKKFVVRRWYAGEDNKLKR